jgi:predicted DsbA family dithiol-disulfide isomerase
MRFMTPPEQSPAHSRVKHYAMDIHMLNKSLSQTIPNYFEDGERSLAPDQLVAFIAHRMVHFDWTGDTMAVPVDVWSDFVCPWCFLVASSLEKLREEVRLVAYWRSYELRPVNSPPLSTEYHERILKARPRLRAIAREQYGINLNEGPFGINSRLAHVGAKYAEAQGQSQNYHMAVFRAYWQQAQPIDDRQVLVKIAKNLGLDAVSFQTALDDEILLAKVISDEEEAYAHGFTGVPALVFLRKYLVSGAQPYDVLKQLVEHIEAGALG